MSPKKLAVSVAEPCTERQQPTHGVILVLFHLVQAVRLLGRLTGSTMPRSRRSGPVQVVWQNLVQTVADPWTAERSQTHGVKLVPIHRVTSVTALGRRKRGIMPLLSHTGHARPAQTSAAPLVANP